MIYEEKMTWVNVSVSTIVTAAYCAVVYGQARTLPVAEIAYQRPLLIAIGATILLSILGSILMSIGTAVAMKIKDKGPLGDIDRTDERDAIINRRGELIGFYVSSIGALAALALAMARYDQFWIANSLYLSFYLGGLVTAIVKVVAYRRGF